MTYFTGWPKELKITKKEEQKEKARDRTDFEANLWQETGYLFCLNDSSWIFFIRNILFTIEFDSRRYSKLILNWCVTIYCIFIIICCLYLFTYITQICVKFVLIWENLLLFVKGAEFKFNCWVTGAHLFLFIKKKIIYIKKGQICYYFEKTRNSNLIGVPPLRIHWFFIHFLK